MADRHHPTAADPGRSRLLRRSNGVRRGLAVVVIALAVAGCSTTPDTTTPDTTTPGTSAVLGGFDGTAATSTSVPSNSEGGIPANPGSVSEERPPSG